MTDPELVDPGLVDPELLAAFWDYERALVTNDVPALERWFAPGPLTLRADAGSALVGAEHIAGFRRDRPPPGPRRIDRLHARPLSGDPAGNVGPVLLVAESTRPDGGRGAQTQVWARHPEGWRVVAAHVARSPAEQPIPPDPAGVWRLPGPLPVPGPAPGDGPPPGAGPAASALAGIRVAVKDLFAVRGHAVGGGSPRWLAQARTEPDTAAALAALLAAGAGVAGLAHTDELAFSLAGVSIGYGAVPNPAVRGATSGGSSSGPAAAVAAGLAELGLGTDTAGSIRVPASYCGIWGLRTTHGLVSTAGVLPLAPSFDTVGLLARDPALLARAAAVLLPGPGPVAGPVDGLAGAGRGPGDDEPPVRRLLRPGSVLAGLDDDVRAAFDAALLALAGRTGCAIEPLGPGDDPAAEWDSWLPAFRTVQAAEAWRAHGGFVTGNRDGLDPAVVARFESGRDVGADTESRARAVLADARARLIAPLVTGTALALPASSSPALPRDLPPDRVDAVRAATLRLTCLASLAGLPAVAVPTMRVGTRPMALSLLGAPGTDHALLALLTRPAPWEAP